jgi:hypothetical protein
VRAVVLLALVACADPIGQAQPDGGPAPAPGKVRTTRNPDGAYTTVVDATSMTDWTYADFETGAEVDPAAPWDLRFQRSHVSANGGTSGTGGVELAAVTGAPFAQVTAPAFGYVTDATDGDGQPAYVLDQGDAWYAYDVDTHRLTPRPIVYVVKTAGGSTIKLEILSYYDAAGTSGWLTLHWAPL